MLYALLLFAQEPTPTDPTPWWGGLVPIIPIVILFYLMLIAPARRENKQRQLLLNALKKNDEVLTSSGIIGVVSSIKDKEDEVTLKIEGDNARIRVLRS